MTTPGVEDTDPEGTSTARLDKRPTSVIVFVLAAIILLAGVVRAGRARNGRERSLAVSDPGQRVVLGQAARLYVDDCSLVHADGQHARRVPVALRARVPAQPLAGTRSGKALVEPQNRQPRSAPDALHDTVCGAGKERSDRCDGHLVDHARGLGSVAPSGGDSRRPAIKDLALVVAGLVRHGAWHHHQGRRLSSGIDAVAVGTTVVDLGNKDLSRRAGERVPHRSTRTLAILVNVARTRCDGHGCRLVVRPHVVGR